MKKIILIFLFLITFSQTTIAQTAEEWLSKCHANFQAKRFVSAVRDCDSSIKLKPKDNPQAYFFKALSHNARGEAGKAIPDIIEALKSFPNDERGLGLLGELYLLISEPDSALVQFNKILQANPNAPNALFARANVYVELGKLDSALADAKKLVALLPSNPNAQQLVADIEALQKPFVYDAKNWLSDFPADSQGRVVTINAREQAQSFHNKPLQTENDFGKILEQLRESEANTYMYAYVSKNRFKDYYTLLLNCLVRFPQSRICNIEVDNLDYTTRVNSGATPGIISYNTSQEIQSLYPSSKVKVWFKRNQIRHLTALLDEKKPFSYSQLASAYDEKGNYEKALINFNKAIAADSKSQLDYVYSARAKLYKQLVKYDLAIADYEKYIQLKPSMEKYIRSSIAEIHILQKKLDLAISGMQKILAQDDKNYVALAILSEAYLAKGDAAQALTHINQAITLIGSGNDFYKSQRALVYRAQGKLDLAYADEAVFEAFAKQK